MFLLAGRIIQAAGLAINLPLTQNVIFTIFPPNKRGAAMGVMGLVMLAGPALGPTLAGLILDTLSWHWIFWVNSTFLTVFSYFRDQFIYRMLMKYVKFQLMHYLLFFQQLDSVELFTDLVYLEILDGQVQ